MALLETINSMKEQGMNDLQIVNSLKEQGITPREINEALSQMRIKSAIANPQEQMQQSIMQPQEQYSQEQYPQQQMQEQYSEQYSQEQYPQNQGYYSQTIDLETVREVAKQEIEAATNKLKQESEKTNKLATELKFEIQNIDNRLNKIESIIQELQSAIIRKMGEYGEAVSNLNQELRQTQNSFAKVINPLIDKKRGVKEESEQEQEEKTGKPKKSNIKPENSRQPKNSPSFEEYFR